MVRELSERELRAFVKENPICVVYLWGPQCSPCRLVTPIVEKLSEEIDVPFGKVNVSDYPDVVWDYAVLALPSVLVFRDGEIADRIAGAKPEKAYRLKIQEAIDAGK